MFGIKGKTESNLMGEHASEGGDDMNDNTKARVVFASEEADSIRGVRNTLWVCEAALMDDGKENMAASVMSLVDELDAIIDRMISKGASGDGDGTKEEYKYTVMTTRSPRTARNVAKWAESEGVSVYFWKDRDDIWLDDEYAFLSDFNYMGVPKYYGGSNEALASIEGFVAGYCSGSGKESVFVDIPLTVARPASPEKIYAKGKIQH